jgi:toxin ParE1/3/4
VSRIEYEPEAISDLAQIWEWLAERSSLQSADRFRVRFEETLKRIVAKHYRAGRLRPELGEGIRSYPFPPYVVFYRVAGRSVQVLRVLHGHRDIREPLMSLLTAV